MEGEGDKREVKKGERVQFFFRSLTLHKRAEREQEERRKRAARCYSALGKRTGRVPPGRALACLLDSVTVRPLKEKTLLCQLVFPVCLLRGVRIESLSGDTSLLIFPRRRTGEQQSRLNSTRV